MRLEKQLQSNALDHEKKPFSLLTGKGVDPNSGKTTAGVPTNVIWQSGGDDDDSAKQNSDHLTHKTSQVCNIFQRFFPMESIAFGTGTITLWMILRTSHADDIEWCILKSCTSKQLESLLEFNKSQQVNMELVDIVQQASNVYTTRMQDDKVYCCSCSNIARYFVSIAKASHNPQDPHSLTIYVSPTCIKCKNKCCKEAKLYVERHASNFFSPLHIMREYNQLIYHMDA